VNPSNPNGSQREGFITGRTVVGLFADGSQAENAIRELRHSGFTADQIGVATQERSERPVSSQENGESDEAATVGALTGGVVGSLLGLLGSLLIPGVGPILVGGVLASLVGAGLGATTGGIIGALTGIGVSEHDAQHFDAGLRAGGTLVTVSARERTDEALRILRRHEADLGPSAGDRRTGRQHSYSGPERRLAS
jgi:hypothetical protein